MKIVTSIIFTILLLTTTFSSLATEEETGTDQNIAAACSPQPSCEVEFSSLEQWIDQLQMQQLMELLKIQQDQPTQTVENNNE